MAPPATTSGRVVVLNGTSSAGKSTLARVLQRRLAAEDECWLVYSQDDFVTTMPRAWLQAGAHVGAHADEGFVLDSRDGRFDLRVGETGHRVLAAFRRAVAGAAQVGLSVIVEEVILREEEWTDWTAVLDGLDALWVRVDLALDVAEARERDRGDRVVGLARFQHDIVHRFARYDVTVDTGALDPAAAADVVVAALRAPR